MKAVEYKVVSVSDAGSLTKAVNKYMDDGWQPLGGICCDSGEGGIEYLQAMTRHNLQERRKKLLDALSQTDRILGEILFIAAEDEPENYSIALDDIKGKARMWQDEVREVIQK